MADADPVTLRSADDWLRREDRLRQFEDAWRSAPPPRIEDYLSAVAEDRKLLVELVHLDIEYRTKAGEPVSLADYCGRFPELARDQSVVSNLAGAIQQLHGRREDGTVPEPPPAWDFS